MRHPSVLGKLLGVTGLGIIWGSPSFILFSSSILLLYSYVSNRVIQERFCHERFGEAYAQIPKKYPCLPNVKGIRRWKNNAPVLEAIRIILRKHTAPGYLE